MARITVQDCLKKVGSRFELVILAAGRAKMLLSGAKPVVEADNREIVTALREVAEGKVCFAELEGPAADAAEESVVEPDGESPAEVKKREDE